MEEVHSYDEEQINGNEKVVINVGGQRHETYINTLKSIPDTRLYWITENPTQLAEYDPNSLEYFFDRHPGVFAQVLNFYRTGKLHCPYDVCGPLFEEELAFWGIDELQVEPCCWLNYKKHREAQSHLEPFEGGDSDGESVEDMDMTVYGLVADSIRRRNRSCWKKYQPRVWTLFEEPYSSIPAQIVAFLTLFFIITSVAIFCLETMPYFSDESTTPAKVIYMIELVCVAAFTLEFFVRLIFCPNKLEFFKKPMNWIDFGAILPFYLQLFLSKSNIKTIVVLRVVRLIRVFRIFKLSRHSYGLQILGHTLKSSCSELFLLVFFLSIGVIIFSSVIYYAEKDVPNTSFKTIPDGFWWAVVTMTTLGYGDMVPNSLQGKIIGSLCAVSGVLMIALPVPVIVSNFSLYYSHAKARMKNPRKKRPLIFGAASALRVAQPFAVNEHRTNVITQLIHQGSKDDDDDDNVNSLTRRSLRNSGRWSPMQTLSWSPRALNSTSNASASLLSRRQSVLSPPEQPGGENLEVPNVRSTDIELKEISRDRKQSFVPYKVIPQVVLPLSPPSHGSSSGVKEQSPPLPPSPLSSKLCNSGSISVDRPEPKSPTAKLRGIQAKSLSTDSSQGSPHGRRGRRGSLYIVGFTAKHWQNKALSKHKERKVLSADNSTEKNESTARGKGFHTSLSCENCQHYMKAHSAEVLMRSDSDRADHGYERNSMDQTRRAREESVSHFNLPKHQLSVTSGTQTLSLDETPIKECVRKESRKTLSDPTKHSQSLRRSESTSKSSDDSLSVHGHLSQRRGSSPLIRQHAVFTFDMAEQSSGNPDPTLTSSAHNHMLSTVKVLNQATSPTLPALSESATDAVELRSVEGIHSSAEMLSPPDEKKNPGRKSKVRPKSLPSGYVNASYQREEEDHDHHGRRSSPPSPRVKVKEFFLEPLEFEKRGFQPYRKDGPQDSVTACVSVDPTDLSETDESESNDQYSKGRRTPLGSVSNASLPSISEEQYEIRNVEAFTSISMHKHERALHRPASVPSESFFERFPLSPHITRATSLPTTANNKYDQPSLTSNYLHPEYIKGSVLQNESLLERRQQPELYLRHLPYRTSQPRKEDQLSFPCYEGVITSPNGKHYTFDALHKLRSLSGIERTSSVTGIERLSSLSDIDDSLLYSPHTPSSFDTPPTKTRDTATSPFITTWTESEDVPEFTSAEYHNNPQESLIEDTGSRSSPSTEKGEVQNARKYGKREASEVELRPISSVEDQSGRKYSLYAVPTALEGLVFYAPKPRITIDSGEITWHESYQSEGTPTSPTRTDERTGDYLDIDKYDSTFDPNGNFDERNIRTFSDQSLHERARANERDDSSNGYRLRSNSDYDNEGKQSSSRGKRLQRTDGSVIYNDHEPLQQKLSGNHHFAKRPASLPSPDRRRGRAIFFGDSGISSVGSGSTTSLSHSIELDNDSKERKENAANILNPIKETEVENPANRSMLNRTDSFRSASAEKKTLVTTSVNIMLPSKKSRENHVIDMLSNSDVYESSVV